MAARAEDLLPVEYFHVVFTLPVEIAQIAYPPLAEGTYEMPAAVKVE